MSDRCTVWIILRKQDIEFPPDEVRDMLEESTDDPSDESDHMLEFVFEDIRYPDDLCGPLIEARIPYRSSNSAGEYPEASTIYDGKRHYMVTLLDSCIVCQINPETMEPDALGMEQIREFTAAKKWFERYLETGDKGERA